MLIITVWLKVCSETGNMFIHSVEAEVEFLLIQDREEDMLSQMIHINKITDKKEIRDPKDDTTFQEVKASG